MTSLLTLNDLPQSERPRERLSRYGSSVLSSTELLALILGRGTRGEPVMVLAQKILSQFGSLEKIAEASIENLREIKGLGHAKASQLKACFEIVSRLQSAHSVDPTKTYVNTPRDLYVLLQPRIAKYTKEHFLVISLDTRNAIIAIDTVSIGILNASIVHPREVFNIAIRRHAATIILSHNHPSGNAEPSSADIEITKRICEAGEVVGIEVADHIIVTKHSFSSLRELGLLNSR